MTENTALLTFPCDFSIKAIGFDNGCFESEIVAIIDKHSENQDKQVRRQTSKKNKYLALTITITATSQDQLDAIYRELSAHEAVVMAL